MATRKPLSSRSKPKARAVEKQPTRLENLAARKQATFDETIDDQLVDNSGVFRVTAAIARAQTGHEEESRRFPSDSLVMAAQREGFRDDGPTIDEAVEEHVVEDETTRAERRARLAAVAARARTQARSRRS